MAESLSGSAHDAEPTADPTTVIGLMFRVLNRPSRTLCLLAILALLLAGLAVLLHAPPIAHLPVGVWGAAISGGSLLPIAAREILRHWRPSSDTLDAIGPTSNLI